jgi:hypothetical protein
MASTYYFKGNFESPYYEKDALDHLADLSLLNFTKTLNKAPILVGKNLNAVMFEKVEM